VREHTVERAGFGQPTPRGRVEGHALHGILDAGEGAVAQRGFEALACAGAQAAHEADAEADGTGLAWGVGSVQC